MGVLALVAAASGAAVAVIVDHMTGPAPRSRVGVGVAGPGAAPQLALTQIVARVDPAVVDITAHVEEPAGLGPVPGSEQQDGTGMVLTPSGIVVTNNHVIEGASSFQGQIAGSGRLFPMRVVGDDPGADVAVLQIEDAARLRTVPLGDSGGLVVGDRVGAIGNALDRRGPPAVTTGTVVALDRSIEAGEQGSLALEHLSGMIQTDVTLDPGNSGGPLLDQAGAVVGMNTAAAATTPDGSGSASGIGFSIPIDRVMPVVAVIRAGRRSSEVQVGERASLGVELEDARRVAASRADPEAGPGSGVNAFGPRPSVDSGAYVVAVLAGSPAQSIGLATGDVITSFDETEVSSAASLTPLLAARRPGEAARVGWVDPEGARHEAPVRLVAAPAQ